MGLFRDPGGKPSWPEAPFNPSGYDRPGGGSPHRVDSPSDAREASARGASSSGGDRAGADHRTGLMAVGCGGSFVPRRFIQADTIVPGADHRTGLIGRRMRGRLRVGALHPGGGDRAGGGSPHRADGPSDAGEASCRGASSGRR